MLHLTYRKPLLSPLRRRTIAERCTCLAILLMSLRYFVEAWWHGVPLRDSTPLTDILGTRATPILSLPFSYDRAWDIGMFGVAVFLLTYFVVTDTRIWGTSDTWKKKKTGNSFSWSPVRGAQFALIWSLLGFVATINFFHVQAGVEGRELLLGISLVNLLCLAVGCLWYSLGEMGPEWEMPNWHDILTFGALTATFTFVLNLAWVNTPTAGLFALNLSGATLLGVAAAAFIHHVIGLFFFGWLIGGILSLTWKWGITFWKGFWSWLSAAGVNGDLATDP